MDDINLLARWLRGEKLEGAFQASNRLLPKSPTTVKIVNSASKTADFIQTAYSTQIIIDVSFHWIYYPP